MKKLLAILMALVMVFSLSLTAFAAPGAFIESPSNNKAPEVIESENESEDCDGEVIVIPFDERDKLPDDDKDKLEDAYDDIKENPDVTDIVPGLEDVAKDKGIDPDDLGVSDLFYIDYTGCDDHDEHGDFDITLKHEDADNFVALIVYKDGKWEIVKDAKIVGDHLVFTGDAPYPYAIVVDTGAKLSQTGDNSNIWVYVVVMAVSAVALVIFWKKSRKQED